MHVQLSAQISDLAGKLPEWHCGRRCWWSVTACQSLSNPMLVVATCQSLSIGHWTVSIPLLVVQPIGNVCPSDTVHCPFQPIAIVFPTHFPPDGHEVVAACQTSLCVFESKLQLQLPSADCRSNFSEPILKYFFRLRFILTFSKMFIN